LKVLQMNFRSMTRGEQMSEPTMAQWTQKPQIKQAVAKMERYDLASLMTK
jgi:hypothetical protein